MPMSETHQAIPVYQQVANILRTQIVTVESDRPAHLPKETELAAAHGVARGTIRQALQVLAAEGLIHRVRHQGTLTSPDGIRAWRNLRKSRAISVISTWAIRPDVPSEFYGQIYQGILVASQQAGYRVSLTKQGSRYLTSGDSPADPKQVIGVILTGSFDERVIAMHAQAGYPVVCTDYWAANPQVDAVTFDCFNEGVKGTQFLLQHGHQRLFYLGNNVIDDDGREHPELDAQIFEGGCRCALQQGGISLPNRHVRYCRRSGEGIDSAVEWFVGLTPRPTAGLIFTVTTLERFVAGLKRHGLQCPRDVSLICKASAGYEAKAATLCNDPFLMGMFAVDLLLERASGKRAVGVRLAIESSLHRGPSVRRFES
jgi:DNA-binding LacI/PurR family transcriptional regulator